MEDGPLQIRFRPMDLSGLVVTKENKTQQHIPSSNSKTKGYLNFRKLLPFLNALFIIKIT